MHTLINVRDILQFAPGSNSTDAIINAAHYNLTALNFNNYTLYDNHTLSNGSACYLTFENLPLVMAPNGTFLNFTSCYDPYYGIRNRGSLGIVFASLFAVTIMFSLLNLRRHGRLFLPNEKRFRAIGRRWQWYWMLFVAACGIISGVSAVDVDSDYLQNTPIILQGFFYYMMIPGILATVWEGVRHWGSWQERQIYDYDPFSLPQDDKRGTTEFYLPLVFYLFAWLNFFMNIPRNWNGILAQGSPQQISSIAAPSGTDIRFKLGAFLAFAAWTVIIYSLCHSVHHYKPRRFASVLRSAPKRFLITIPLLLVVIGYVAASSFIWGINPLKYNVNAAWLYGLGYAPILLILVINEIGGMTTPNEDKELLRLRNERGRSIDAELGLGLHKKPHWWTRVAGDNSNNKYMTSDQRLRALTSEIGGGRATQRNIERTIELGDMSKEEERKKEEEEGRAKNVTTNPFKDYVEQDDDQTRPGLSTLGVDDGNSDSSRAMSQMTISTVGSRPQQVRSMLDV